MLQQHRVWQNKVIDLSVSRRSTTGIRQEMNISYFFFLAEKVCRRTPRSEKEAAVPNAFETVRERTCVRAQRGALRTKFRPHYTTPPPPHREQSIAQLAGWVERVWLLTGAPESVKETVAGGKCKNGAGVIRIASSYDGGLHPTAVS